MFILLVTNRGLGWLEGLRGYSAGLQAASECLYIGRDLPLSNAFLASSEDWGHFVYVHELETALALKLQCDVQTSVAFDVDDALEAYLAKQMSVRGGAPEATYNAIQHLTRIKADDNFSWALRSLHPNNWDQKILDQARIGSLRQELDWVCRARSSKSFDELKQYLTTEAIADYHKHSVDRTELRKLREKAVRRLNKLRDENGKFQAIDLLQLAA